jgi:hypothetical protein
MKTVRRGDIAIFPRVGARDNTLAFILGLIVGYQFWGWHIGIIYKTKPVLILEAESQGMRVKFHNLEEEGIRTYHWLSKRVHQYMFTNFMTDHQNYPYDYICPGEVMLSLLTGRLTKYRWRIVDNRLNCWELVASFCRYCSKPIQPIEEYPLLPKILQKLEGGTRL